MEPNPFWDNIIGSTGSTTIAEGSVGGFVATGQNQDYTYGNGDNTSTTSYTTQPVNGDFKSIVCAANSSFGIDSNDQLWFWGNTSDGTPGNGRYNMFSSPVQVGSFSTYKEADTDGYATWIVKTNGTLWRTGVDYELSDSYGYVQVGTDTNWKNVTYYTYSTLAIKTNGTLWGYGDNYYGQLGNGTPFELLSITQIGTDTDWSEVSIGSSNAIALKTDGTMWGWGLNDSGQLGLGDAVTRYNPVQIGSSTWTSIGVGLYFAHAVKTDGTLWAWGSNSFGVLGDGTIITRSSPVQIGALTDWSKVCKTYGLASFAIKTDGTMWAWGANGNGQLGDGTIMTVRSSPVQVGSDTDWESVAGGGLHAAAIKTNGTMWAWGANSYFQLGDGTNIDKSTPVQIGTDTTWNKVITGDYSTRGIKDNNTLWSWGTFNSGVGLPDNSYTKTPALIDTHAWKMVAGTWPSSSTNIGVRLDGTLWVWGVGSQYVTYDYLQIGTDTNWKMAYIFMSEIGLSYVAIKTTGTLHTWGANNYGQLALGDVTFRSSPVQVGALTDWNEIATGDQFVIATKTNGTLWAWGFNFAGNLGNGNTSHYYSPIQIGSLTDWSKVKVYYQSVIALKTNGTMWTWGENDSGQLGLGDMINRSSPTQVNSSTWIDMSLSDVMGYGIKEDNSVWAWGQSLWHAPLSSPVLAATLIPISGITAISKGIEPSWFFTKTNGTLWAVGSNYGGQLGLNSTNNANRPYQILTGTNASIPVNSSTPNMAFVNGDGTLWMVGDNNNGQLGDSTGEGAGTAKSSPVQVGTLTNWSKVAVYAWNTIATKTDGTLWAWGSGWEGLVGDGTNVDKSSPVQIGALTDWGSNSHISMSSAAHIIKPNGTLWAWGYGGAGQIGDGATTNRSSPVQIGALTNWSKVRSSGYRTYAIKTDGTLWAWGQNGLGLLGDNTTTTRSSPVQIGALTNWKEVVPLANNVYATKTDGTLWAWGENINNQLGDGTAIYRSSPVQVGSHTDWDRVWADANCGFAVKTDKTLWAWGDNNWGKLGLDTGDEINRSSPEQVANLSNVVDFLCTDYSRIALLGNGTIKTWGYNLYGELGLESLWTESYTPVQLTGLQANYLSSGGVTTFIKTI